MCRITCCAGADAADCREEEKLCLTLMDNYTK